MRCFKCGCGLTDDVSEGLQGTGGGEEDQGEYQGARRR